MRDSSHRRELVLVLLSVSCASFGCKRAPATSNSSPIAAVSGAPAPALPVAPLASAQPAPSGAASEPTLPAASASSASHDAGAPPAIEAAIDVPYRGTLGTDRIVVRLTRTTARLASPPWLSAVSRFANRVLRAR